VARAAIAQLTPSAGAKDSAGSAAEATTRSSGGRARPEASPQRPSGRVTSWALRLEAEILLREDAAAAERRGRGLAERAAELCSTELSYEAQLLRAKALLRLDRGTEAAAALEQAERALALWSRMVPLGEGRDSFFARHDELGRTEIAFWLAQATRGRAGAPRALAVAVRRSVARFVGSLAVTGSARLHAVEAAGGATPTFASFELTRDRWPAGFGQSPALEGAVAGVCAARDAAALELRAPTDNEAPASPALLLHPTARGLLVVVWRGAAISISELDHDAAEDRHHLMGRIVAVAAQPLAGAARVELYVHHALAALPLDRALAAALRAPVAFAVDAPRPLAARCAQAPRALLVTNPQRNLWAASEAAPALEAALARHGWIVDRLEGAAATRAAIVAHLVDPCTAVFAYEGHATSKPGATADAADAPRAAPGAPIEPSGAKTDRSDDALLLAGGESLSAIEVLGLSRVPRWVVLNGCTTAAPEGLGLAQAFVMRGAEQVVASLEELSATDAAAFTPRLFAEARSGGARIDLVARFFAAFAAIRDADVPGLRVYERVDGRVPEELAR
jgi:CHAT domain